MVFGPLPLQGEAMQIGDPFQCDRRTVAEVIQYHKLMTGLQQHITAVAPDEAGPAGDQQLRHGDLSM